MNNQQMFELKEIEILKKWTESKDYEILFDSELQIDNFMTLLKTVNKKQNLCFIHFDYNSNVFGGFLSKTINRIGLFKPIYDPNAFVFSLIRNGEINNKKYQIKKEFEYSAFSISTNSSWYAFGYNFNNFGGDISCNSFHDKRSFCQVHSYDYGEELQPFVDLNYPNKFELQRRIILQMK